MLALTRSEIRELLAKLAEPDFEAFCIDHFPTVHRRFTNGMDHTQRVNTLFQYVADDELLGELSKAKLLPATDAPDPAAAPPSASPDLAPRRSRGLLLVALGLPTLGVVLGGALAAHYLFQRIAFLERLTQLQASCLAGADCGELAERQRRDCESDRPTSCIQLGLQYRAGKGTEQDNSKAADLFDRACNRHKNPLGCFYLGFMHEQGWGRAPNDEIISSLYRYACNAGVWKGCNGLGYLYERGRYTENGARIKSTEKAVALYRTSCDAEDLYGCLMLGYSYHHQFAYPKIAGKEEDLFSRACTGGVDSGCSALGQYFEETEKNLATAVRMYEKACALEGAIGCYNAATYYRSQGDLPAVATKLQRACTLRHGLSCTELGEMHENGVHYSKDEVHASELYRTACDDMNEPKGCLLLSRLYSKRPEGKTRSDLAMARACLLYDNRCPDSALNYCADLKQLCSSGYGN